MQYQIKLKPKAIKDLSRIPAKDRERVWLALETIEDNLRGDVKRLTNFTPEFRLRVGNYRVLFEIEAPVVTVYRVRPRGDAYK
ncbi:MAG: type II toxin-antitoxin system RelE/ParE family toxin [Candidatus Sumerlaeota bacterium]|nr:type II toxin-antitoxin system RelE/ParE family toxin [Candidatus Sumerlaeota bacterium]